LKCSEAQESATDFAQLCDFGSIWKEQNTRYPGAQPLETSDTKTEGCKMIFPKKTDNFLSENVFFGQFQAIFQNKTK
jgi:hypothetical protein